MARDRKRAKQRRDRRTSAAPARARVDTTAAPSPLEHASADVDAVEAQIALGRPDLAEDASEPAVGEPELAGDALEAEPVALAPDAEELEDAALAAAPASAGATPQRRAAPEGNRLANFFRGSWRELQRVQWPDRRQVAQATGVVIGFVVIAGAFLGFADFLAGKVVDLLIK